MWVTLHNFVTNKSWSGVSHPLRSFFAIHTIVTLSARARTHGIIFIHIFFCVYDFTTIIKTLAPCFDALACDPRFHSCVAQRYDSRALQSKFTHGFYGLTSLQQFYNFDINFTN